MRGTPGSCSLSSLSSISVAFERSALTTFHYIPEKNTKYSIFHNQGFDLCPLTLSLISISCWRCQYFHCCFCCYGCCCCCWHIGVNVLTVAGCRPRGYKVDRDALEICSARSNKEPPASLHCIGSLLLIVVALFPLFF